MGADVAGAQPPHLRVGFFGVLGSGNVGNDASLDVLVSFMRRRHPRARLGFFAMGPSVLEERYGAPATSMQWYEAHADRWSRVPDTALKILGRMLDPVRTLVWCRRQDVIIVPGMGVLETTTPSRPWALPFALFCACLAARLTGARVALVCVGADVVPHPVTRWLITQSVRLSHYRSYRDPLSRSALEAMGVYVSRDAVYPDLAFALPVPGAAEVGARTVAVGVMNYRGSEQDRHRGDVLHERYAAALEVFVSTVVRDGWHVRLFAGDQEDLPVMQRIHDAARRAGSGSVAMQPPSTLTEVMDWLAGVEVVVATRYHSVLAGLHASVPTLSISYARKSDALVELLGLGEFHQDAASVDPVVLLDQFRTLHSRRDEIAQALRNRNEQLAAALGGQFTALSSFLADPSAPDVPVDVEDHARAGRLDLDR